MKSVQQSWSRGSVIVLGAALLFAACGGGDVGASRLKSVREGMSRDSAILLMGRGPLSATLSDTLRLEQGFRRSAYFIDGALVEVLYYREVPGSVREGVTRQTETPIVVKDGRVLGWGWRYFDAQRTGLGIPDESTVPAAEQAPLITAPDTASM
jgi:hypothetical protein